MIETTIMLKPESNWRAGMTEEKLIAELEEKLSEMPGYVPGFLQPIRKPDFDDQHRHPRAGRHQNSRRRSADDLRKRPSRSSALSARFPARSAWPRRGCRANRIWTSKWTATALAHYGLRAQDVLDVVEGGIGGDNVSTASPAASGFRSKSGWNAASATTSNGSAMCWCRRRTEDCIPLGSGRQDLAAKSGRSEIASENGRLRVFVQANVEGRDLGGFVKEAQARLAKEISLPPGMTIEWSGQYENQIRAQHTLRMIVPAALFVIFLLLYIIYHSSKEAAHVILAVPFALTGGVFLQWLLGYNFSVAVWVGYIALFGTAIQTGVVMVVYLDEAVKKKMAERGGHFSRADLIQAVKDGARLRLRPKVMTVATIVASLLPILWSHRTGAEVMKPLATPVIGGMVSSLACILIVTPVIFAWLREREMRKARAN